MNARTYDILWREIPVRITHTPERWGMIEHLEIESRNREPLPITETGYRSHFLPEAELQDYIGPVEYVTAWLDQEAESEAWKTRQDQARQFSLF